MNIRVLALCQQPRLGPSSRYRLYEFQRPLLQHGVEMHISPFFTDPIMQRWISGDKKHPLVLARAAIATAKRAQELLRLAEYDVIYVHRQAMPFSDRFFDAQLIGAAKRAGVPLGFDMDDSVFNDYNIDPLLQAASFATVGNRYLAEHVRVRAPQARVVVIPTVVDTARYKMRASENAVLVVGWVGTPSTFSTYLQPMLPQLVEVCRRNGAVFRVITNGLVQREAEAAGAEFVEWSLAEETAQISALDVGVMPLQETASVRGKCAFKLIQYGAVGTPSVGSDIGANNEVIQEGETGHLAQSAEAFPALVETLLQNAPKRQRMGQNARQFIENHFSLAAQVPVLAEVFKTAAGGRP